MSGKSQEMGKGFRTARPELADGGADGPLSFGGTHGVARHSARLRFNDAHAPRQRSRWERYRVALDGNVASATVRLPDDANPIPINELGPVRTNQAIPGIAATR